MADDPVLFVIAAVLLHGEPPLLLSGTAGSGKTTIAVYFLLRHRVRRFTPAPAAATAPADPGARGIPARDPVRHPAHGTPVSASRRGPPAPAASRRTGADGSTTPGSSPHGADAPPRSGPAGGERALFLTCSAHLKRFSERIYRGLVKATELEHTPAAVRFATLGELLGEVLGHAGRREWQAPPAGLAEFGAILRNHPGAARYDTELVWEEIRSIIKGAKPPVSRRRFAQLAARFVAAQATGRERAELAEYVVRLANLEAGARLDGVRARKTAYGSLEEFAVSLRDGPLFRSDEQLFLLDAAGRFLDKQSTRLDQPLLTLREYEGLGHKRAPNFPFDRREIHRIAEYYQKRLAADERYDEIDQTRAALQYLERHGDRFRLMHGCLYRGAAPDRRQRVAALLDGLPAHYRLSCLLPVELSDLIVDLRRYDRILRPRHRAGRATCPRRRRHRRGRPAQRYHPRLHLRPRRHARLARDDPQAAPLGRVDQGAVSPALPGPGGPWPPPLVSARRGGHSAHAARPRRLGERCARPSRSRQPSTDDGAAGLLPGEGRAGHLGRAPRRRHRKRSLG